MVNENCKWTSRRRVMASLKFEMAGLKELPGNMMTTK